MLPRWCEPIGSEWRLRRIAIASGMDYAPGRGLILTMDEMLRAAQLAAQVLMGLYYTVQTALALWRRRP